MTLYGGGQNVWDVTLERYTEFLKVQLTKKAFTERSNVLTPVSAVAIYQQLRLQSSGILHESRVVAAHRSRLFSQADDLQRCKGFHLHAGFSLPSRPRSQDLHLHSYRSFLGTNIYGCRDRREPLLPRPIPPFHVRHFDCHRHRSDHSCSSDPTGLGNASTSKAEGQNDHLAGGRWRCDRGDSRQGLPELPIHVFEKYVYCVKIPRL